MLRYDEAELEALFTHTQKNVLLSGRFIVGRSCQRKSLFFKAAMLHY